SSAAVVPNRREPRYRSPASPVLSPALSSIVSSAPSPSRSSPASSRLVMFRPRSWPHRRGLAGGQRPLPYTLALSPDLVLGRDSRGGPVVGGVGVDPDRSV